MYLGLLSKLDNGGQRDGDSGTEDVADVVPRYRLDGTGFALAAQRRHLTADLD